MKKVFAILVTLVLMMSVCMSASAATFSMAFDTVEVEEGTASVTLPLNATVNDGVWAFIIEMTYDTTVLTFDKAEADAFNITPNEKEPGLVKLVFDAKEMANVTTTGVIANVTFKVIGAAGTSSEVAATCPDPASNIDVDFTELETSVAPGSVSIVAAAPSETEPTPTETEPAPTEPAPTEPAPTTVPTEAPTQAPTNPTPVTGSAIPTAAVVLASASAAVLCFARKK